MATGLTSLVLAVSPAAEAQPPFGPPFKDGDKIARAMERHFNGSYKATLAKASGKIVGRILCAHDPTFRVVECSGHLRIRGVAVKAAWELEKRTSQRAKLRWTFKGKGIFDSDNEIVAPSTFGLRTF